jgi:hypothetical protein
LTVTPSNIVAGDAVTATASMASFDNARKNVGNNLNLTYSGLVLSGADANNYALASNTISGTGSITAQALSLTGTTVANKTYDGSTNATIVTNGTLSGFIGNETLLLSNVTGTFASAAVGTNKTVSIAADFLPGANGGLASNYVLAATTAFANIDAPSQPQNPLKPIVPRPPVIPTQTSGNSGSDNSGDGSGSGSSGNPFIALPKDPNTADSCTLNDLERCTCDIQSDDGVAICYAPAKTANNQPRKQPQTANSRVNRS